MPITATLIKLIIADQKEEVFPVEYLQRSVEPNLKKLTKNKEIIILTGLRRAGKSVVLNKLRTTLPDKNCYFNFEDERLATFTVDDFQMLYQVFLELYGEEKIFYFDEIQNISGWEMFVRRLYNQGYKIFITGSNATLFSEELGTRLTGRYISLAIYPFSFLEIAQHAASHLINQNLLSTKEAGRLKKLFNAYCDTGGIPAYVSNHESAYLHSLYDSIIYRDIVSRYKIGNADVLRKLIFYLASHCGKEMTFNALRKLVGLGSTTTVSDYCGYLESSYLCFFVNRYHASLKTQSQSPKKIYFIDHALAKTVGFRSSEDKGRLLENIIFIELKRRNLMVYYHREKKECDFVVHQNTKITAAIQVCFNLEDAQTRLREIEGLLEAMQTYSLSQGIIITDAEENAETIRVHNKQFHIRIVPAWKWLMSAMQGTGTK